MQMRCTQIFALIEIDRAGAQHTPTIPHPTPGAAQHGTAKAIPGEVVRQVHALRDLQHLQHLYIQFCQMNLALDIS